MRILNLFTNPGTLAGLHTEGTRPTGSLTRRTFLNGLTAGANREDESLYINVDRNDIFPVGTASGKSWHHIFLLVVLTLFVMAGLMFSSPVLAESSLNMEVKTGLNGFARIGQPVLFNIVVENPGPEIKGVLKISTNQEGSRVLFTRDVVLPAGSKKNFTMYASEDQSQSFQVLLSARGKELASVKAKVIRIQPQEFVLGVMAGDPSALNQLSALKLPGEQQRVTVLHLQTQDLPAESNILENIDVLVFSNFSTSSLSRPQLEAVQSWVERGGLLVAAGGGSWQKTLSALPEWFLPVEVTGSTSINQLPELEKWAGRSLPAGKSLVVSKGRVRQGNLLVSNGGNPIMVEAKKGAGTLLYLAFDPGVEPLVSWPGSESLWLNLLTRTDPHHVITASNARIIEMDNRGQLNWILRTIPASDLPSVGVLGAILLLYVLILGPGLYLLLKKFDRRELGWVAVPLTAILLFSATYLIGFKGKGRDVFTNVISIIKIEPGCEFSRVNSFIGTFAPTRRNYSINLTGNRVVNVLSLNDGYRGGPPMMGTDRGPVMATINEGKDTRVQFNDLTRWSTRSVQTENTIKKPGNIEGSLQVIDGTITGSVKNNTANDLSNCIIFSRFGYQRIGDIAAGETVAASLIPRFSPQNNQPMFLRMFQSYPVHRPQGERDPEMNNVMNRTQIMESILRQGQILGEESLFFIGWSEQQVEGILQGRQEGKIYPSTMWLSPLQLSLVSDNKVCIPPGIINGRLVEVNAANCHQDSMEGINIGGGTVTFQLDLPAQRQDLQIDELVLLVPVMDYRMGPKVDMYLYNWSTAKWEAVKYQLMGIRLDKWQPYISDQGALRIKIGPSNANEVLFLRGITINLQGHYPNTTTTTPPGSGPEPQPAATGGRN